MSRKKLGIALAFTLLLAGGGVYLYCGESMKAVLPPGHKHEAHEEYTCPMHPTVKLDHPGSCPICGMDLVKTAAPAAPEKAVEEANPRVEEVSLSPQQLVTANVSVVEVGHQGLFQEIRSPARVTYDESLQSNVTSWVAGRIDRLYVSQTGQRIGKGEAIAEIYSPDLVTAQQEYLTALESYRSLSNSSISEVAQGAKELLRSAKSRLKLLGVTEGQLARLTSTRRPQMNLTIYSPISGTVIQKLAQLGQYVGQGQPLFQTADLSRVWVEASIYEDQLANVHKGQKVNVVATAYPGKPLSGRISFISPVLDPQTRTAQARIALSNSNGILKPEMNVEARIQVPQGEQLVIPASAVVDTGTRKVVWIQTGEGRFAPREVTLGNRAGEKYPVLSGLSHGEKVAATGAYLIDSSSQMRSLGSTHEGHSMPTEAGGTDSGAHAGHEGHGGRQ